MEVDQLEAFIDETIRLGAKHRYHPTTFKGMRARYGTVAAISKLVQSGELQSGFKTLKALGLVEWTIEAAVLKFPDRFSRTDRECAEFRLRLARDEPEQI